MECGKEGNGGRWKEGRSGEEEEMGGAEDEFLLLHLAPFGHETQRGQGRTRASSGPQAGFFPLFP